MTTHPPLSYSGHIMGLVIILYFSIALIGGVFLFRFLFKREISLDSGTAKNAVGSDQKPIIADLNRRLSSNPRDVTSLMALGQIYFDLKDYSKALTYYKVLSSLLLEGDIKVSPFTVYLNYGICCAELHMYDDAHELLVMAQSIDSTSFEVNYYLGVCEYYKRQYESAFKHLKIATLAKPDNMQSLKYLGFIFFQAQNYKNSLMCLNRVQQSEEKTAESSYYFGYALLKIGKREDAYTILSGLINDPDWGGVALKECSDISFKSGQYDQAINLGLEALNKKSMNMSDKDKAEVHYVLGNSYSQLRDTANALQHYRLVKSLSNSYSDINDKIDHLQEMFYNRNLQTFLNSSWPDFEKQSMSLISLIFPNAKVSSHQRMNSSVGETVDILAEIETRQWQDVVLVRYIRDKNQVGEIFIRDLAARLKEYKAGRGVCITAGSFSPAAKMFVEARLIDLVDKNKLIAYLQRIK